MSRSGFCECGCGRPAPIAKQTRKALGHVRGTPVRFIPGHHASLRNVLRRQPYDERDCGYVTACWVWLGTLDPDGYGRAWVDGRGVRAHRLFYEQHRDCISADRELDHLCRNRACVNPDHLESVTDAENTRRGAATKLTLHQARAIKAALRAGEKGRSIAARFNVSAQLVCDIKGKRAWRDV